RTAGHAGGRRVGEVVLVRPSDAGTGAHFERTGLELEDADRGAGDGLRLRPRRDGGSTHQREGNACSDPLSTSHGASSLLVGFRHAVVRAHVLSTHGLMGWIPPAVSLLCAGTAFQRLRPRRGSDRMPAVPNSAS